jgi:Uma2 family endonuclease
MAMPAQPVKRWTADEARRLNEANALPWPRYEVIDGELLVSPAPRFLHQRAVKALLLELERVKKRDYFLRNDVGEYWIVDLDARVVERWKHGETRPDIVSDDFRTRIRDDAAIGLDIEAFFTRARDE